jgi:hypothetical protein
MAMENQTYTPDAWIGTVKVHRTRGRSRSYPTLRLPEAFLDLVGQTVKVAIAAHSVFINPPNGGLSQIGARYDADSPVEAPTRVQIPTRALLFCFLLTNEATQLKEKSVNSSVNFFLSPTAAVCRTSCFYLRTKT